LNHSILCRSNAFWSNTIRYDTIEEFNVDSKAEYTLKSTADDTMNSF